MMTNTHFETYAPGMKARLDPTFRREFEDSRILARSEILSKIARGSSQSFLPFGTTRKNQGIFGRR